MGKTESFEMLHDVIAVLEGERNYSEVSGDDVWALRYDSMIDAVRIACGMLAPRVMTLEEALEAGACWIEHVGHEPSPCLLRRGSDKTFDVDVLRFGKENRSFNSEYYGWTWRCWNMEPDDEQMEETAWEAR